MDTPVLHRLYRRIAPHWVRNGLERSLLEIERFSAPRSVTKPPGTRVLLLAPHPDDESIACGGTLHAYAEAGVPVRVSVLTDGCLGDPQLRALPEGDPERTRRERALAARRREEAIAAMRALGVAAHDFLDARDGSLAAAVGSVGERLARILREWRPDVVLVPFLSDRHPDHFAANRCLMDAAERLGAGECERLLCLGYESWSPLHANLYVDITPSLEAKRRAIRCHESQLAFNDYLQGVEGLNRYRAVSGLVKGTHAEAFFMASFPDYRRLFARMLL
ncbi:MAG TPA: PIG-L deacetylase family protein [Usitatibacter sp.]|nr:PIG-L deacetylase family protein [Usitatibacter sp.]